LKEQGDILRVRRKKRREDRGKVVWGIKEKKPNSEKTFRCGTFHIKQREDFVAAKLRMRKEAPNKGNFVPR